MNYRVLMNDNKLLLENLNSLLSIAVSAAKDAAREILKVYTNNDFETQRKEDNSPVTVADQLAHDVIVKNLEITHLPILSEEGKNISYNERREWSNFWLIDPLDGTKEFLKRNGEFTVNIALMSNSVPVLGVVMVPTSAEVYYAITGQGSYYLSNGNLIKLKERRPLDLTLSGLRVVASRSHMNKATADFINRLRQPQLVTVGSSLKFIAVAKGEADAYPRFIPCMEWDTAAADVIIREVGLKIMSVEDNLPLTYNKENLINPFFICG